MPRHQADGWDAGSDAEFRHFLRMAQRSASEVVSHLRVAAKQRDIDAEEFKALYGQAQQTRKVIGGITKYLQESAWLGTI